MKSWLTKCFSVRKKKLMEYSRLNRTVYEPTQSFFSSKSFMESTFLFKAIRQMPKGAVLHTHDLASGSLDWLIKNVTYREHLYYCLDDNYYMYFAFSNTPPHFQGGIFSWPYSLPDCTWKTLKSARDAAVDVEAFDHSLKQNLSLLVTDPLTTYADDNAVWNRFGLFFNQVYFMLYYAPVFKDYFWQVLTEFRDDNVLYLELRAQLSGHFDLDGQPKDAEFGLNLLQEVTEAFTKEHPDFMGSKFIMSGLRQSKKSVILEEVKEAMKLHAKYPDSMLGYDLVGQEPCQHTLLDYMEELLYPSMQDPPFHLPYFFHAAETTWQGTGADYNLMDAILLNTTRIGHGYAIDKHPLIMQLVKERGIAVEVNPISNQLLRLVNDVRNHPMVPLIADNFPVVVSSDDHMAWEALPLSHDFYVAFMDMCGEDSGLAFLKQLAVNSLKYSVFTSDERDKAMQVWQTKWDKFIESLLSDPNNSELLRSVTSKGQ